MAPPVPAESDKVSNRASLESDATSLGNLLRSSRDDRSHGRHLSKELLHVNMNARDAIQQLPSVLTSLGPADVDLSIRFQITATLFKDYVPYEVRILVSDDSTIDKATIDIIELGISDVVRFRCVVCAISTILNADEQLSALPELIDDLWSEEGDHEGEVWQEHIDDLSLGRDYHEGEVWQERIEQAVQEVLAPKQISFTQEELIQMLASWSHRSVAVQIQLAKFLGTATGIYFSSFVLQPLQELPRSSVRRLFPFAVMLKNAAASPAGAAEMKPLSCMIRQAVCKADIGSLVRQELYETLSSLDSCTDSSSDDMAI
eukprot:TRINITY_DN106758_c0_g1_i1.p1 TRINITY_DN106758_c0_g1~~TRINITY_DN106758_c0_g1_i1.p1  ORF type:complete len:317 (-),score=51.14 TRINITY_DN106758_c0_g1_i1:187-1137(-)